MNIYAGASLITSVLGIALALFILYKCKERVEGKVFALVTLLTSIWTLCPVSVSIVADTGAGILLRIRIIYLAVVFIPSVFLHLMLIVSGRYNIVFEKIVLRVSYAVSFLFLPVVFRPEFIEWIDYTRPFFTVSPGYLYNFFTLFFASTGIYGSFKPVIAFVKAKDAYAKMRLRYFSFAGIAGISSGLMHFCAVYFNFEPFPHDIFVIAYFYIIAYAIIRHRLMDIRVAITRTGIFLAVYGIVLGLPIILTVSGQSWLVSVLGKNWWFGPLILMASLATLGPFVYIALLKGAEAILLKEQRHYQETLKQAAMGITRIRSSTKLLNFLVHIFTKTVRISHAAIYLFDAGSGRFVLKASRHTPLGLPQYIEKNNPLIIWLGVNKEPLVYDEIRREAEKKGDPIFSELASEMRQLCATVIVVSFLGDTPADILILGNKHSGRTYTSEDLNNFSVLVNEATLAIENALRYENIEEQVRQRTKELVEVQKQLIQAEKLATVGTLAGGVAHEINNPLAAILTNVQMLLSENQGVTQDTRISLQLIEEATKRCRNIVQKLMMYAKKPMESSQLILVGLRKVVESVEGLLRYQFSQENISIKVVSQESADFSVLANKNELEQVVTNLLLNAKDAIKDVSAEGVVEVILSETPDWVLMRFKDQGRGIPPELIPKIFDPFFTTKDVGKGTGLGLSICQSIIEKYNGIITVESVPGKGSVFTVKLPREKKN